MISLAFCTAGSRKPRPISWGEVGIWRRGRVASARRRTRRFGSNVKRVGLTGRTPVPLTHPLAVPVIAAPGSSPLACARRRAATRVRPLSARLPDLPGPARMGGGCERCHGCTTGQREDWTFPGIGTSSTRATGRRLTARARPARPSRTRRDSPRSGPCSAGWIISRPGGHACPRSTRRSGRSWPGIPSARVARRRPSDAPHAPPAPRGDPPRPGDARPLDGRGPRAGPDAERVDSVAVQPGAGAGR